MGRRLRFSPSVSRLFHISATCRFPTIIPPRFALCLLSTCINIQPLESRHRSDLQRLVDDHDAKRRARRDSATRDGEAVLPEGTGAAAFAQESTNTAQVGRIRRLERVVRLVMRPSILAVDRYKPRRTVFVSLRLETLECVSCLFYNFSGLGGG